MTIPTSSCYRGSSSVSANRTYYSAILAEIVGSTGHVTALEVDAPLAARAEANLAPWPQVAVLADNGFTYRPEAPVDAIIVNAGVATLSPLWLDALKPTGRLLVPLTNTRGSGGFLLVARSPATPQHDAARFVSRTRIFLCADGRPPEAEARLEAALRGKGLAKVRSLHRGPVPPDASCWLAGEGWWLSAEPVPDAAVAAGC